ncbi:hypothetical protein RW095_01865 [Paraburkholderia kirstenboschensis]|uniref:Transposase n=1 Tax=Paraburkholderia kirstenboschensis TaxID=1245436 RepID=A0ABZ0EDK9_9BURK|nr:hypothetical protein [Paraburkholderia kirstenboschensis]WOD14273.1 hypothetical protein RW095_01865 [Paraburkholderia kirstenboschensis]
MLDAVTRMAQEYGINVNLLRKWITKYLMEREKGVSPTTRDNGDDLSSEFSPARRCRGTATRVRACRFVPPASTPPSPSMTLTLHVHLSISLMLWPHPAAVCAAQTSDERGMSSCRTPGTLRHMAGLDCLCRI